MNTLGIALLWCIVQVTVLGLVAAGMYLLVRRLRPAAAAPVALTALALVVLLSLMALSPWPRWNIPISPRPLAGEGPGVRADESHDSAGPLAGEGLGVRAGEVESAPVESHPSAAAVLWQTFLEELAKPQPAAD